MNTFFDTVAVFEPWQAGLHLALAKPLTITGASGSVNHLDGHRAILRKRGDEAAVEGLATPLRYTLVELAGVEATTARMLARKVRVLAAHRAVWASEELTSIMIETAITTDATALGLRETEQARLLQTLRGEP